MNRTVKGIVSALALLPVLLVGTAFADPVVWTLNGVTFEDGTTATGSFVFDADANSVIDWNVSVQAGGFFTDYSYTQATGTAYLQNLLNPVDTVILEAPLDPSFGFRGLRMTPVAALTNAGGIVALNLNTSGGGSGGVECYNCSPHRLITAGSLSAEAPVATQSVTWSAIKARH
jgi:hypothetical protein